MCFSSPEDCWFVAKNKVYDVSSFIAMGPKAHPGGMAILLRKGGQDVTRDFKFHSSKARSQLWTKFEIGYLMR